MEDTEKTFKHPNLLKNISIPDSWESCYEFAKWWVSHGNPILMPEDKIYLSDDAASVCLFRKGQFQVELYLVFPTPNLPIHEHPGVEVIKSRFNFYDLNLNGLLQTALTSPTLMAGEYHGAGINFKEEGRNENNGFPLLAIQKWDEGLTPTTIASRWRGKSVGPRQEQLVLDAKPDAYVKPGYIDVTRTIDSD